MIRVTVWNEFQHERTQEKVTGGGAFGSDGCV